MKITRLEIPDIIAIEPKKFTDDRGFFSEVFNQKSFDEIVGQEICFVQDNHSRSYKNVLRGLHYQIQQAQGKLVRVISGSVFDVAVDLRKSSPTFGKWAGIELSEANQMQLWIPPGFAHGFFVLSEYADFLYKTTEYYAPQHERTLLWNDHKVNIEWPLNEQPPVLSEKDRVGFEFDQADVYA